MQQKLTEAHAIGKTPNRIALSLFVVSFKLLGTDSLPFCQLKN